MSDFTQIFCIIDDFFKTFEPTYWQYLKQEKLKIRIRPATLTLSEIVFIAVYYKISQFTHFKAFYQSFRHLDVKLFRALPSYERMIYLIHQHQLALHALHYALTKPQQGELLWLDSTILPVCKNHRIQRHRSLKSIATRGKSSMGWFFGCKLHILMNQDGDIVRSCLSNGHVADIKKVEALVDGLTARVYADRGYISQELKEQLARQGIDLVTYQRKNMQATQLAFTDEYHLRQRNRIETLFSLLKGRYQLVTTLHRCVAGYLAGIYASLIAYQLAQQNKPKIHVIHALAYP